MNGIVALLIVALAIGLLFLAVIVAKGPKGKSSRGRAGSWGGGSLDRDLVVRKWAEIQGLAAANRWASAVSEADKLLDYAMQGSGFRGANLGERLKSDGRRFSDIDGIWRAHKLRNSIAHDVGHDVVVSQARDALNQFERGLRDLGAL